MHSLLKLLMLLTTAPCLAQADSVQHGLRVPAGFTVTEYADSRLANDIYTLTLDPRGRVVVAGRGYIRILVDDDGDGRADRAIDFADGPKDGAMGLLWDADSLFVTGDGGLRHYHVKGDRADGPSELIRAMKTGGEHAAHALRRGPDGWLYLLCGNNTDINRSFAQLATSPIQTPVAGCVLRFTPDLKSSETVADGFRNPYGMDFNTDSELFTFDSDNERCVALPWYEPTRFYHVVPGRHYGWLAPQRAEFWRLPPYFCDVVPPVITLGRGSPTGVACYRSKQFPAHYHGGFFVLDWTFGRVYFLTLQPSGASYTARKEVFLQAVGENGFAPTGIVVHPKTGDLFISIGGRGTRGAVYRVHYQASGGRKPPVATTSTTGGSRPPLAGKRLRALIALRRDGHGAEPAAIRANWDSSDRLVRAATADLIATLPAETRRQLGAAAHTPWQQATFTLALVKAEPAEALHRAGGLVAAAEVPAEARLAAVRVLQLALGDLVSPRLRGTVWEGYSLHRETLPAMRTKALDALRQAFPCGQADLDRELSRTLAVLQDDTPATLGKVADRLAATADPIEQTHYLIVLARLTAPRPAAVTARTADALLGLDRRLAARHQNRDSNWPLRVGELYAELARRDAALPAAILGHEDFGRPDHVLFTQAAGFDRLAAARIFLARAKADKQYGWNAALVKLVGALPEDECLPVLRRLWGQAGLEAALLPVLARKPRPADRGKFLTGLGSPDLGTVRLCLEALGRLPPQKDLTEAAALVGSLGRLPAAKEGRKLAVDIALRLRQITGQTDLGTDRQGWAAWLGKTDPALAARLSNPDGVDVSAWAKRFNRLDWSAGDSGRGKAVFVKASCANCHSGGQALGPDLHGVTGRFSRPDLLTAIVQPSRDISPRYRTTLIETTEGKVYQGLVIYEAADGLLLQTATATVRLPAERIASQRFSPLSLMPAGLLDPLADRDIADLYAYLRNLGSK
jgi:putative heme-binding domain-containing protein